MCRVVSACVRVWCSFACCRSLVVFVVLSLRDRVVDVDVDVVAMVFIAFSVCFCLLCICVCVFLFVVADLDVTLVQEQDSYTDTRASRGSAAGPIVISLGVVSSLVFLHWLLVNCHSFLWVCGASLLRC